MKKILIMDDDTDLLAGLCIRLSAHGYATLVASDATVAIQKMLQEKPDLVLLDIGLPDQKGFVVLDHVKQSPELGAVPVIIVSTRPSDVYRDAAVIAGATGYFEKPFNNEALFHAIHDALAPLARESSKPTRRFQPSQGKENQYGKAED